MPSSAIRSFAYDAELCQLSVTFVTGRQYIYFRVPPDVYQAMTGAFSKGRYFNAHVRDRYDFDEATAQPADT